MFVKKFRAFLDNSQSKVCDTRQEAIDWAGKQMAKNGNIHQVDIYELTHVLHREKPPMTLTEVKVQTVPLASRNGSTEEPQKQVDRSPSLMTARMQQEQGL